MIVHQYHRLRSQSRVLKEQIDSGVVIEWHHLASLTQLRSLELAGDYPRYDRAMYRLVNDLAHHHRHGGDRGGGQLVRMNNELIDDWFARFKPASYTLHDVT